MRLLTFDTETTGLISKYSNINNKTLYQYPEIVQLSWVVYDDNLNKIISVGDYIVSVEDIPPETTKVHRITNEISKNMGRPINEVMNAFKKDWDNSHVVIAHNKSFDLKMLEIEALRVYRKNVFENTNKMEFCTMKEGYWHTDLSYVCKKTKKRKKKNSTLMELHEALFNSTPNNLHNAFIDILVCFRCAYQLIYKKDPLKTNMMIEMPIRETKQKRYVDDLDFKHVFNYYCNM